MCKYRKSTYSSVRRSCCCGSGRCCGASSPSSPPVQELPQAEGVAKTKTKQTKDLRTCLLYVRWSVIWRVPLVAQWVKNPASIYEDVGWIPGLAQWIRLRIQCYHKLWHRSQMLPGSGVAVAQAGSCSSNLTPSLETSTCHRYSCKKEKMGGERVSSVK